MKHRWLRLGIMTSLFITTARALALVDQTDPTASGPTTTTSPNGLVTRSYSIRDMLWVMTVPGYSNLPAASPPTTQPDFAANAVRLTRMILDAMPEQIDKRTITATNDGFDLTVTAPAATQAAVADAFEKLRSDMLVQVSVETRVYSLPPATFQRLPFRLPTISGVDEAAGVKPLLLSAGQFQQLERIATSDLQASRLTTPRMTLFNHQKAVLLVNAEQAYVADYTPIAQPSGETSYKAKVATIPSTGLSWSAQAVVSADRRSTAMQIRLDLSRLIRLDRSTYRGHDDLIVQVPVLSVLSVAKTIDLPSNQPLLVAAEVDAITGEHQLVVVKSTILPH